MNIEKWVVWDLQIQNIMSIILETKESNALVCSLMSGIFTDRPSLIRRLLAWNE